MLEDYETFISDPFYTEAAAYREEIRIAQIVKGAEKYGVPLNPANHTPRQLLQHAMEENVDQGHYIFAMGEALETLEAEIARLKNDIAFLEQENQELRRVREY